MAGLDTRGAFDGFVQGFGMMQNYRDGQDRKEYMKQQQGMQQRGLDMREQEFAGQQEDRQKTNDQQYITQFYERTMPLMQDADNPESLKMLTAMFEDEEASTVLGRNKLADMRHLFNPKTIAAAQYAGELGKGEGQLFSDKTASAMNDYFSPEVNRMPGRRTRINGVYPGQQEGTMAFDLGITPIGDDDTEGEEYFAPMTSKRGIAGEDDDIMQVPIEQMINKVRGAQMLYEALGPEKVAQIQKSLRAMGYLAPEEAKWEDIQGPGGSILQRNTVTGETKQVLGRAPLPRANSGAAFAPSNDVKTIEYLISQGMTPTEARDEVVRLKRGSTGDSITASDRYKVTYLTNQIKEIDSQLKAIPASEEEEARLVQQRTQLVQQRNNIAGQLGLIDLPGTGGQMPGRSSENGFNADPFLDGFTDNSVLNKSASQHQPQQGGPIAGKVYSDANGNKARWNGTEYVPVDAGQPQLGMSDSDQELRKLWSTAPADTSRQQQVSKKAPKVGYTEAGYEFAGGDPANPLSWKPQRVEPEKSEPTTKPKRPRKKYQLDPADIMASESVRNAISSAPGDFRARSNATSLFRKTMMRNPTDEELDAMVQMGTNAKGKWSAPHWKAIREQFDGN